MKKISIFLIISMIVACFQTEIFADSEFADSEFALSSLIVRKNTEEATIYWVNDEAITDLNIVNNKTGEEIDVENVSMEKGAINQITAPLQNGTLAEYEITCNNKTILVESEQPAVSTSNYTPLNSNGWSVVARTNLCVAEITEQADNNVMRLTRYGNAVVLFSGTAASGYETGKSYQLSFDYKGKNATSFSVRFGGVSKTIELADASTWTTVTEVFTISSVPSQLNIQVLGTDVDLMLDNVNIRLNEDDVVSGENLLENGDFESTTPPSELAEITAAGISGGVEFSWEEADAKGYMLWIDGEYTAFLDKSTTSYSITGLEDDTLVTAEIAVKGKNGLVSEKTQKAVSSGLVNVPVPDQSAYQPKRVIARTEQSKNILLWKNPQNAPTSAAVYRLTENGEEFIEGTYNLGANVSNEIELGGEVSDYYKLRFTFSDGTVSEYFTTVRNVTYGAYHNWNPAHAGVRMGFNLIDENPHSGKYAYKLFRNEDKNAFLYYVGDVSAITAGTYRLGLWYRGSDYTSLVAYFGKDNTISCSPSQNEWQYVEKDITIESANPTVIFKMNGYPEIYLDDITLYKIEDGVLADNVNLLENGDFETVTEIQPVKSYTAVTGDGKVNISWELPSDANCAGVNVYVNNQLKGSFFAGKNEATIGGLVNGRKNDIRLVTINTGAAPVGESVEFKVIPKADAYSIDEIILKKNGTRVGRLSEGTFTVETAVRNNRSATMNDVMLVTALYVDGEMKPLMTDSKPVVQSGALGTVFDNSFTITVDMLEKELTVKSFVIDSLNGKLALSGKAVFDIEVTNE